MSGKVHRRLVRYNENNPLCHLPNTDKHKIKLEEHWHNHILPDTISYACERKELILVSALK